MRWLVGIVGVLLVAAAPASARIDLPPTGAIDLLANGPPSVAMDALESDTTMFAFDERRRVTLPSDIPVDIVEPGAYTSAAQLVAGTIPAGIVVDSAFVHVDTVTTTSTENGSVFDGSLHVDGAVLGIAVEQPALDATDVLAPLGTLEPTGFLRRRINLDREDVVTLSADRRTVTVHSLIADKLDQLRIISATAPRPNCSNPTITGGPGNEITTGTEGDDVIVDREGNNTIDGLGGNDVICTGPGNDDIDTGSGDNIVFAGAGNDQVQGGDGNDTILASDGGDGVTAGDGVNTVLGGSGSDTLTAGAGTDLVDGGAGHDDCDGDGGANVVVRCEVTP